MSIAPHVCWLANKRKLFEKAQLKRQYAKLLKKEAATAGGAEVHANIKFGKAAQSNAVADVGDKERAGSLTLSPKRKRKERAEDGETNPGCDDRDGHEKGQREQHAKKGGQQQRGKWRRPEHRPDPFKAAKVKYDITCTIDTANVLFGKRCALPTVHTAVVRNGPNYAFVLFWRLFF